jgi:hypothetical protein
MQAAYCSKTSVKSELRTNSYISEVYNSKSVADNAPYLIRDRVVDVYLTLQVKNTPTIRVMEHSVRDAAALCPKHNNSGTFVDRL